MILSIVSSCRRKENIPRIIKALKDQTVPPDLIWVFFNGPGSLSELECDNVICSNNSNRALCRFSVGLSVDFEYLYLLDDDVFPECGYIENCLHFIRRKKCIIGSSGIALSNLDETKGQEYHGLDFGTEHRTTAI